METNQLTEFYSIVADLVEKAIKENREKEKNLKEAEKYQRIASSDMKCADRNNKNRFYHQSVYASHQGQFHQHSTRSFYVRKLHVQLFVPTF
jgi:hypothetical protein